ncbi:MAG: hypothetical protein ABIJ56_20505 [Pseudomonadota bacterium]
MSSSSNTSCAGHVFEGNARGRAGRIGGGEAKVVEYVLDIGRVVEEGYNSFAITVVIDACEPGTYTIVINGTGHGVRI